MIIGFTLNAVRNSTVSLRQGPKSGRPDLKIDRPIY